MKSQPLPLCSQFSFPWKLTTMLRQLHQGHRKDVWSGLAVIGACGAWAQFLRISIMNFIKSPKKWSGQNLTSQTGSYMYVQHDHPKAASRVYLSIGISKQLNAALYLWHKPWQLLAVWEKTVPAVRWLPGCDFMCALVLLQDQWLWSLVWEQDYVYTCAQH